MVSMTWKPLPLRSILDAFGCVPDCPVCLGSGTVCEHHPDRPSDTLTAPPIGCDCGGAGMPCPEIAKRHA